MNQEDMKRVEAALDALIVAKRISNARLAPLQAAQAGGTCSYARYERLCEKHTEARRNVDVRRGELWRLCEEITNAHAKEDSDPLECGVDEATGTDATVNLYWPVAATVPSVPAPSTTAVLQTCTKCGRQAELSVVCHDPVRQVEVRWCNDCILHSPVTS